MGLESRRPLLELLGGRAARAERRVHGEQEIVRDAGELRGALEVRGQRLPARGARDLGLKSKRLGRRPDLA